MKKSVESCIFCAPSPCSCNVTSPKKKPAKKAVTKEQPKQIAIPAPPEPPKLTARPGLSAITPEQPVPHTALEDAEYARALTVLLRSQLIDWKDVERHWQSSNIPEREARVLIWKLKRMQHIGQS